MEEQEQTQEQNVQMEPTPPSSHKKLIIGIATVIVLLVTGGLFVWLNVSNKPIACTKELKICPDGSGVERAGPNCEYAECSGVANDGGIEASDWETYKSIQFAFEISYPKGWSSREESQGAKVRNYVNINDQPEIPINMFINYYINDNPNELNLDNYLSEIRSIESLVSRAKTKQNLTIGGQPTIKLIFEGDYAGSGSALLHTTKTYKYYISQEKDIVSIKYVLPKNASDDSAAKVVSTLNFIFFDQKAYDELLQKENAEIIGIDADNDGVWDDIQQWIDTNYSDNPKIKKSLKLMAKEIQFKLLNARNKELIIKHSYEIFGVHCLFKADFENSYKISGILEAEMVNSTARFNAYLTASDQLGGQVYINPDDETVSKYCGF